MPKLIIALLLIQGHAFSAPLDDALDLVTSASVVVLAARENAQEAANQREWSAYVRLAYQTVGTEAEAIGFNSGAYLKIPLFSRKVHLEATKARYEAADTEHRIRQAFLADVAKITKMDADKQEALHMREFYTDRMEYFKEAEAQGLLEPAKLWPQAEKAQTAHYKFVKAETELKAKIEEISRSYGHKRWKQLQNLLVAHLRQTKH